MEIEVGLRERQQEVRAGERHDERAELERGVVVGERVERRRGRSLPAWRSRRASTAVEPGEIGRPRPSGRATKLPRADAVDAAPTECAAHGLHADSRTAACRRRARASISVGGLRCPARRRTPRALSSSASSAREDLRGSSGIVASYEGQGHRIRSDGRQVAPLWRDDGSAPRQRCSVRSRASRYMRRRTPEESSCPFVPGAISRAARAARSWSATSPSAAMRRSPCRR